MCMWFLYDPRINLSLFTGCKLRHCYKCLYIGGTLCVQLLLQFYTVLFETLHVLLSWSAVMNVLRIKLSDFFFCFMNLSHLNYSFHDSSYI